MKKVSKYEYEEGPINSYWNTNYRAPFSAPPPVGSIYFFCCFYAAVYSAKT